MDVFLDIRPQQFIIKVIVVSHLLYDFCLGEDFTVFTD